MCASRPVLKQAQACLRSLCELVQQELDRIDGAPGLREARYTFRSIDIALAHFREHSLQRELALSTTEAGNCKLQAGKHLANA